VASGKHPGPPCISHTFTPESEESSTFARRNV
jgi:hypothetical protein